jgi:hypothetical protein
MIQNVQVMMNPQLDLKNSEEKKKTNPSHQRPHKLLIKTLMVTEACSKIDRKIGCKLRG